MTEIDKNTTDGNLTQKEIIQLLLHNAQHMATREEVKSDILRVEDKVIILATKDELSKVETTLKEDIQRVEDKIIKLATKDELSKVETALKEDIQRVEDKIIKLATKDELSKVETALKEDIARVEDKITNLATKDELSKVETALKEDISRVETTLKEDNKNLSKRMDRFMFWSLGLTVTSTFLILGLIYKTIS